MEGDPGQLGHRLLRVRAAGAGQPHWRCALQPGATQGDARDHHPDGLCRLRALLLWRASALEPRRRRSLPGCRRVLCLSHVVRIDHRRAAE